MPCFCIICTLTAASFINSGTFLSFQQCNLLCSVFHWVLLEFYHKVLAFCVHRELKSYLTLPITRDKPAPMLEPVQSSFPFRSISLSCETIITTCSGKFDTEWGKLLAVLDIRILLLSSELGACYIYEQKLEIFEIFLITPSV